MKIKITTSHLLIAVLLFVLAGAAIWFVMRYSEAESCQENYQWLNPQLRCADKSVISKAEYSVFKDVLLGEIEGLKQQGKIKEMAIYFRDLNNGPTFGINERDNFVPASLLKLPLMLTYYKLAEENPLLLSKTLVTSDTSQADGFTQHVAPEKIVEAGKPYAVEELLFKMIAYSDNRAWFMLTNYLKKLSPGIDLLAETYSDIGITNPQDDIAAEVLTAKSYASIFRLLYNTSYLSKEYSDRALEHLAYSDFEYGLRRGVPEHIPIAHKFGERWFDDGGGQLHDCGIIYYPDNPYLLCVMVRGERFESLSKIITDISHAVYEEVDSRRQ